MNQSIPKESAHYTLPVLHQGDKLGFSIPVVFRSKAPCAGNGLSPYQARQRRCGTPQERPKGWPVSVHGCVLPFAKDSMTIHFKARLTLNADRPTESQFITLVEY
jgi:hypothetical protein